MDTLSLILDIAILALLTYIVYKNSDVEFDVSLDTGIKNNSNSRIILVEEDSLVDTNVEDLISKDVGMVIVYRKNSKPPFIISSR